MSADGQKKEMIVDTCRVPEPVIEAVTRQVLEDASKGVTGDPAVPEKKKPPPGCVERVLNFKDRNYLVGACTAYCEKEGRKTYKDLRRLDQLKKLVDFESTLDHSAAITDAIEEAALKWEADRERYNTWRRYSKGLLDSAAVDAVKKRYPDMDLKVCPGKPPLRPPTLTPEEQRGPESTFHIPSKLDAWIQDALKAMEWQTIMTEYSVELCEKFGIQSDG